MNTVKPHYNEVLEDYLVVSGFSLNQSKKKKKELGPAKLLCYKKVLLYLTA